MKKDEEETQKALVKEPSTKFLNMGSRMLADVIRDKVRRLVVGAFQDKPAIVLVVGPSGVGKSHLVNNLGNIAFDTDEVGSTVDKKFIVRYDEIPASASVWIGTAHNMEDAFRVADVQYYIFLFTTRENYSMIAIAKLRDIPKDKPLAWMLVHAGSISISSHNFTVMMKDYQVKYAAKGRNFDLIAKITDKVKSVPNEGWLHKTTKKRLENDKRMGMFYSKCCNYPGRTAYLCKLKLNDPTQEEVYSFKLLKDADYKKSRFNWIQKYGSESVESRDISTLLQGHFSTIVDPSSYQIYGSWDTSMRAVRIKSLFGNYKSMAVVKAFFNSNREFVFSTYCVKVFRNFDYKSWHSTSKFLDTKEIPAAKAFFKSEWAEFANLAKELNS